ncbi:MAG: LysM peptidoglycan-binding domain-containing protein [Candidatus Dojkabacteria bacterium]|nr:MAG: LysM peptidoglycan-binding domain-containing protein [Candidatus Dojkabacteria bacterium]
MLKQKLATPARLAKLSICVILFTLYSTSSAAAIEYEGIGLKPAHPDPDNERTKSIFIYNLAPGVSEEDEILVINNTDQDKTVLLYATDSQKSTDGSFACEQYLDSKDKVGGWINLEAEELDLAAHTSTSVRFNVEVPEVADVGEQNGCIMLQEKKDPTGSGSGVSLSFRTGLRVVVTVPGEQVRKLSLTSFRANQASRSLITTRTEIRNDGNVSIDAKLHLVTAYFWGIGSHEEISQYPILRGDTGVFNIDLQPPEWGGLIKTSAIVEYDNSSEASVGVDSEAPNTSISSEPKYLLFLPQPRNALIELGVLALVIAVGAAIWLRIAHRNEIKMRWDTYTIKSGENLEEIAKRNNIGWKKLANANKIKPPYNIEAGRKIKIPPRE